MYRIAPYGMVTRYPECIGYVLESLSKQSTFVPDSQWNVYRIARYRVTELRIWHKKLSDTTAIRYRVTEAPFTLYRSQMKTVRNHAFWPSVYTKKFS